MENERIEGKVAQLLTDRELVINRGAEDGVEAGMRFAILVPSGTDIRDPDTGEILGSVELAKTYVKVVSVMPKVAVAKTFRTIRGTGSYGGVLGMINGTPDRDETLRSDQAFVAQELDAADSLVKIGDPAVQVAGEAIPSISM